MAEGKKRAAAQEAAKTACEAEAKTVLAHKTCADSAKAVVFTRGLYDSPVGTPEPPVTFQATTPPAQRAGTDQEKSEAYWRGRLSPLIERYLADAEVAQRAQQHYDEVRSAYRRVFLDRQENGVFVTVARVAALEVEMLRLEAGLRPLAAVLAADNAAIEALKEEGRRAGAFPGWFR